MMIHLGLGSVPPGGEESVRVPHAYPQCGASPLGALTFYRVVFSRHVGVPTTGFELCPVCLEKFRTTVTVNAAVTVHAHGYSSPGCSYSVAYALCDTSACMMSKNGRPRTAIFLTNGEAYDLPGGPGLSHRLTKPGEVVTCKECLECLAGMKTAEVTVHAHGDPRGLKFLSTGNRDVEMADHINKVNNMGCGAPYGTISAVTTCPDCLQTRTPENTDMTPNYSVEKGLTWTGRHRCPVRVGEYPSDILLNDLNAHRAIKGPDATLNLNSCADAVGIGVSAPGYVPPPKPPKVHTADPCGDDVAGDAE